MNKIEAAFVGVLGSQPELKTSAAGKPWAAFNVRVGDDDAAQWVRVAAFGEMAATARELDKGSAIYVEGRLTLNNWTTQNGVERSGLNVAASLVTPLGQIGRRKPKPASRGDGKAAASNWQRPLDREPADASSMDEPIPF